MVDTTAAAGSLLPPVTGDDDDVEDSVGAADEGAEWSTNPLDTEPFGDPTDVVVGGPAVLGGSGAWRFLRSEAAGWVVGDAGMVAGATADDGLDLRGDVAATLPLPTPVDTTGTYDFLQCSCVDVLSLGT